MLAHELRNPLASIHNALEVQRRLGTAGTRLGQMRDIIERQTEQLTRLVDDLLDVSRISQCKITLRKETVDLLSVVARAVETSRPVIDGGGHRLTVSVPSEPVEMKGDAARLAQAVSNLLNNAAKYTERGGNIWLTATVEGGEAEVRVKDDGIGIPAEALPRVFDLFAQSERSLDRAQGGLGIGLTLVKNIVDLHGGRAEIFSPGPGQGCEVVLRLPRGAVAPASAGGSADPSRQETASRSRCRVLVVDDNLDAAESLAMLLQLTGQEVRTAHDGRAAVDLAVAFAPHLVLLDIGLPGMDGYQVAAHLRERLQEGAVLVAVTGYGQPEDRQRSRAAGFDHHLTKPVDYEDLQSLIAKLAV